jgi:hypothetical protein
MRLSNLKKAPELSSRDRAVVSTSLRNILQGDIWRKNTESLKPHLFHVWDQCKGNFPPFSNTKNELKKLACIVCM